MADKTTLAQIQAAIKAPKGQWNSFGKYNYRSAEDIVEAVKIVVNPLGFWLTLTDKIVQIGDRIYIESTATLTNGSDTYSATAYAREEEIKKGMDGSQVTGAASSYARKYALNGLFAIDDTKDSDATNQGESKKEEKKEPQKQEVAKKEQPGQAKAKQKIADKAFQQAFDRISKGEQGLVEKIRATYTLTEGQEKVLEAFNNSNIGNLPAPQTT